MPDDHLCSTPGCGREKRSADLLCRRCWYVLPDDLKQPYLTALAALKASKTRQNIEAILVAKTRIINSVNPKGNPHGSNHQT